jgi:hypothetical protein
MLPTWSVMMRTSQQRDKQHPPAGQAPLMAATVTKGDLYNRARKTLEVTQKSRYLHQQTVVGSDCMHVEPHSAAQEAAMNL